jgi:hypothetical protein
MSYKKKTEPTTETKNKEKETKPDVKKNQPQSAKPSQPEVKSGIQKSSVVKNVAEKNQDQPKVESKPKPVQKQETTEKANQKQESIVKPMQKQEPIVKSAKKKEVIVNNVQKQEITVQPMQKQETSTQLIKKQEISTQPIQKQETIPKSKIIPDANPVIVQKIPSSNPNTVKPFTNASIPPQEQNSKLSNLTSENQADSKAKIAQPSKENGAKHKVHSVSIERSAIKTVLAMLFGVIYPFFGLFLYTGLSLEGIRLYEDLMLQISVDPYDTLYIWSGLFFQGNIIEEVSINGINAFYSQPTMAIALTWLITTYFMAVVLKSLKKVILGTIFVMVILFGFYSIFAVLSGNMMAVFDINIDQTINGLITMVIFAVPGAFLGFFVGRE